MCAGGDVKIPKRVFGGAEDLKWRKDEQSVVLNSTALEDL